MTDLANNGAQQAFDDAAKDPRQAAKLFLAAVKKESEEDVERLVTDVGFDPNSIITDDGETALHVCARRGSLSLAKLLIKLGADPLTGTRDRPGLFPIFSAIKRGRAEFAVFLAQNNGFQKNPDAGITPFLYAASVGKVNVMQALIDSGAQAGDTTPNKSTALLLAIHGKQTEAIKYLLALPETLATLDTAYTATDSLRRNAFHMAVGKRMLAAVNDMIDLGVNINAQDADGYTPLHRAVEKNYFYDLVKTLVEAGADLNTPNSCGWTPLMTALGTIKPDPRMVSYLLENGADPEIADNNGNRAIHIAVESGDEEKVMDLLCYPIDLEARNNDGATPFFSVFKHTNANVIRRLVWAGARINARHARDGGTVLMHAVEQRSGTGIIQALLENGADPFLCNAAGLSPLALAEKSEQKETADMLRQAMTAHYVGKKASFKPR